ncbi:polysaccharide pyruvyl transferase family protein [Candidatus Peregrinibacteria bacterium]|nr:polysaccharide pyruvyl transferase family protein [Candidatus Peregrinibacteria bacterium]
MHIGLFGNYGATNIGDEAILEMILKSHPDHRFTVFSANPRETAKRYNVEAVPLFPCGVRSFLRGGLIDSKKALQAVDAIVLGGGGLFQDDHLYACLIWAWQTMWAKHFKKPLFIYAVGVGPLRTWLGKKLTRYVFNYASQGTVRDENSKTVLGTLGVDDSKFFLTDDPVFLSNKGADKNRTNNLYIISVRPWKKNQNQRTIDSMTKFLKWLKETKNATFLFTVMQSIKESDDTMAKFLAKQFDEQIFCPKNFNELMNRISECEGAIGMRYHFGIAAFLTDTPYLGISYSPKVTALFRKSPEALVPLENVTAEALQKTWGKIIGNKEVILKRQKEVVDESRNQANKNSEHLEAFLKKI